MRVGSAIVARCGATLTFGGHRPAAGSRGGAPATRPPGCRRAEDAESVYEDPLLFLIGAHHEEVLRSQIGMPEAHGLVFGRTPPRADVLGESLPPHAPAAPARQAFGLQDRGDIRSGNHRSSVVSRMPGGVGKDGLKTAGRS
jgi:hypothetical protein